MRLALGLRGALIDFFTIQMAAPQCSGARFDTRVKSFTS